MSDPLATLFLIALVVFIPTSAGWLWLIVSLPLIQRQHARLREYMANMPPVPAEPAPESDGARAWREVCNEMIRDTLDAASIAVMAHAVRSRK